MVLDSRFKLRYVQLYFSQIYSQNKCTDMVVQVETKLNKLFKYYEEEHANSSIGNGNINVTDDDLDCEASATTSMAAKFL